MCGTPKTNPTAKMPKTPFRSFMASMTLAQRQRFADVANRAQDRREIREHYQQRLAALKKPKARLSLWSQFKLLCVRTARLMG